MTEYVPGVEVLKSITPEEVFTVKPTEELYVPPGAKPPAGAGTGFVPLAQTGVVYVNPVTGVITGSMVMLAVLLPAGPQMVAATV